MTYACHCSSCQKRTGSAFSMGLVALEASCQIDGALTSWTRVSDNGVENTRYSCAACGNIIYGASPGMESLLKLQAGLMDNRCEISPDAHIWMAAKQTWFTAASNVPQFDEQPDPLTLLAAAQSYQNSGSKL